MTVTCSICHLGFNHWDLIEHCDSMETRTCCALIGYAAHVGSTTLPQPGNWRSRRAVNCIEQKFTWPLLCLRPTILSKNLIRRLRRQHKRDLQLVFIKHDRLYESLSQNTFCCVQRTCFILWARLRRFKFDFINLIALWA